MIGSNYVCNNACGAGSHCTHIGTDGEPNRCPCGYDNECRWESEGDDLVDSSIWHDRFDIPTEGPDCLIQYRGDYSTEWICAKFELAGRVPRDGIFTIHCGETIACFMADVIRWAYITDVEVVE